MVPAVDKPGMKRKKFEASSYQASSACLKITGSATLLGHTHRHTHTLTAALASLKTYLTWPHESSAERC